MTPEVILSKPKNKELIQIVKLLNSTVSFGLSTLDNIKPCLNSETHLVGKVNNNVIGCITASKVNNLLAELLNHKDIKRLVNNKLIGKELIKFSKLGGAQ